MGSTDTLAEIIIHPDVENYIIEVDWQEVRNGDERLRAGIVQWFEDGHLILLKNHGLRVDYELLNSFKMPASETLRKLPYRRFLYPKPWKRDHRLAIFGAFGFDMRKYLWVRRQVKELNADLARLSQELFPNYRFLREQFSWRLLETPDTAAPLHIDFHSGGDMHYLRLFLNLDVQPRVWEISHRLDETVLRYHEDMDWPRLNALNADMFFNQTGDYLRNDVKDPCHVAKFHQGDLWLCDTRKISHGVLSGNRTVATHFWVDRQSMDDPSKRIEVQVANLRAKYGPQAKAAE